MGGALARMVWLRGMAVAAATAGCATVAPPPVDPGAGVVAPAQWSAAAGAARDADALALWWRRFGDATLTRLITDALAANTDIAAATAALRQARALADAQRAQGGPTLDASGSVQRSRSGSATGNTWRAGFDAAWEPDIFGRLRSAAAASERDALASEASLGDVQVSVAAEVALTYIALRGGERRLAIAQNNLASQEETLQITRWRVQAGLATSLDAEQARNATEQTRAQLPALRKSIAQARHQLALLAGRTVDRLDAPEGAALPQAPSELALAFPADTLRQRADVRAAEQQVHAAAERVAQAEAARLPNLVLSGSLGLAAGTLSGLGAGGTLASSLTARIAAPLVDGGAARAQQRAQEAALDRAQAAYRAAVLTALREVEDALVALARDRERLAALENAADAAANAALLARHRYASGLIDFRTVLDVQRALLGAQDGVASARAEVAADHVRLYKALGGGWQPLADARTGGDRS